MPRYSTLGALLVGGIVACGPAISMAQDAPSADLRVRVAQRLARTDAFSAVSVTAATGIVTLDGRVESLWTKERAVEQALKVDGVQSVVSHLVVPRGESDDAVRDRAATQIRRYVFYTIFDSVDLSAADGVVRLTGYVNQPYKIHDIGRLVTKVHGVQGVDNRIEALPASIFDSELRSTLAARLYNHPLFSTLAFQSQPPLHIVVRSSRVVLTGVVNSEVQRRAAEHIVRGTFGVLSVQNQLRLDSEMR
jgi:osmotically-inducible protein OsmY